MNHRLKLLTIVCATFIMASLSTAQPVTMFEHPQHYQLYPRDGQDSCAVPVSGIVNELGYSTATLAIIKNEQVWRTIHQPLVYSNGHAEFSFTPKIHAELINHRFVLQIDGYTIIDRRNIVCGDVFVLNGQSNTVAPGETDYESEWVRTFGTMSNNELECFSDTTWDIAVSDNVYQHAAVGVWGVVMGNKLSEYLGMPVAVINGAIGATTISHHQRNEIRPWSLRTIYGRLMYRLHKSGLHDDVRSIFWHQGESDSPPGYAQHYAALWDSLYNDWHQDYPALEHIYLFQIRAGIGEDQDDIREIQRQLPYVYDNVHIMSTVGINGFDGLHFSSQGYEAFGEMIWPLAAQDLYERPLEPHSEAPDIVQAWYTTANQDQIAMEFTDSVTWPADTLGVSMSRYIYLDDGWGMVESGLVDPQLNNVVMLNLSSPRTARTVSYLSEDLRYHGGEVYHGPWIRNPNGIGALTFMDIPIQPSVALNAWSEPENQLIHGDSLTVFMTLENTTNEVVQRQIWTEVVLHGWNVVLTEGPHLISLEAFEAFSMHTGHYVPDALPPGFHEYRIFSGSYPDAVVAADTVRIEVLPN
jgi:hypothetical protein